MLLVLVGKERIVVGQHIAGCFVVASTCVVSQCCVSWFMMEEDSKWKKTIILEQNFYKKR